MRKPRKVALAKGGYIHQKLQHLKTSATAFSEFSTATDEMRKEAETKRLAALERDFVRENKAAMRGASPIDVEMRRERVLDERRGKRDSALQRKKRIDAESELVGRRQWSTPPPRRASTEPTVALTPEPLRLLGDVFTVALGKALSSSGASKARRTPTTEVEVTLATVAPAARNGSPKKLNDRNVRIIASPTKATDQPTSPVRRMPPPLLSHATSPSSQRSSKPAAAAALTAAVRIARWWRWASWRAKVRRRRHHQVGHDTKVPPTSFIGACILRFKVVRRYVLRFRLRRRALATVVVLAVLRRRQLASRVLAVLELAVRPERRRKHRLAWSSSAQREGPGEYQLPPHQRVVDVVPINDCAPKRFVASLCDLGRRSTSTTTNF